jgi:AcrR family transcriptional regulator
MPRVTGDVRRAQILEAAGRLVRQRGFTTTRMADVAAELGLSAPSIVYHFGTKDELMAATLAAEARAELERLDAIVASDLGPVDKVRRIIELSLGAVSVGDWALWIDAWGEGLRSPVMARHLEELDRRWRRALEHVITEGIEYGVFAVDGDCAIDDMAGGGVRAAAERLMATLDGFGVRLVRSGTDRSRRRVRSTARQAIGATLGVSLDAVRTGGHSGGPAIDCSGGSSGDSSR